MLSSTAKCPSRKQLALDATHRFDNTGEMPGTRLPHAPSLTPAPSRVLPLDQNHRETRDKSYFAPLKDLLAN